MYRIQQYLLTALCCLALLSGCKSAGEKRQAELLSFWSGKPLLEQNIGDSEERFADFAELAVTVPEDCAKAAIDSLFERLNQDEVAYYIYAEWLGGAFYSFLSPCRNCNLFKYAADRILKEEVLDDYVLDNIKRMRTACTTNRRGSEMLLPRTTDDEGIDTFIITGPKTLFLVVDLSCPSCREALNKLGDDPQFRGAWHVALCSGPGKLPDTPGWSYFRVPNPEEVYDLAAAPFYFVVDADGKIETEYTFAL